MKLTDKQIRIYLGEAAEYTDRDAFASDIAVSAYGAAGDADGDIDPVFVEQVARLWDVARLPFRELLAAFGLSQTACSQRFCVPLKTVQNWCGTGGEARACSVYIRLMMAELLGYLDTRA